MDCKINRGTILIKLHYFLFFAGLACVLPFLMVYGSQVGVSVELLGFGIAIILIATVIVKPVISAIADSFPKIRKVLFVSNIIITCVCFGSMGFIKPFGASMEYEDAWLLSSESEELGTAQTNELLQNYEGSVIALPKNDSCFLKSAQICEIANASITLHFKEHVKNYSIYTIHPELSQESHVSKSHMFCKNAELEGDCSPNTLASIGFWQLSIAMLIGSVSYSIVFSFTDAIILDIVGPDGDFGRQRFAGSLGWGTFGLVSGILINKLSPVSGYKNYNPAFIAMCTLLILDVIAASRLNVPALKDSGMVWNKVKPLLRSARFSMFLLFSTLTGVFTAVIFIYLFMFQEDIARRRGTMENMKLLQGFSVMFRSFSIIPFLIMSNSLLKRFGADKVISFVFFVSVIRMGLLVLIYYHGPMWTTLIIEILAGPTYGLACPTIVIRAGQLAPTGISTTVQSVASICFEVIGHIIASSISGVLIKLLGMENMFLFWSVVAAICFILHIIYYRNQPKETENEFQAVSQNAENVP